ncbi:MAG: DUF6285 domain-containing protein [Actinomycetota bacterium]
MIDEPDAVTLLDAMASTLSDQVVPATSGGAQHSARVVANLCRILARDLAAEGPGRRLLADRAGYDGTMADLVGEFDALIEQTTDGGELNDALQLLLADAIHRAEIAKPGYTDHGPS